MVAVSIYSKQSLDQGLIWKIKADSTLSERGTKNFSTPYSISFPSVLHQNKAFHEFHKRGQLHAGHKEGLD